MLDREKDKYFEQRKPYVDIQTRNLHKKKYLDQVSPIYHKEIFIIYK